MSISGTVAVDLDGTLARYDGWKGIDHIGDPIPLMVSRVRKWLNDGVRVVIFTARAQTPESLPYIYAWCKEHLGVVLPVTNIKTFDIVEIWDDRAVQVIPNKGTRADGGA